MNRPDSPQHILAQAVERLALPRGTRVLLAVSGGPDSVALLDTLAGLRDRYLWSLWVGHVNHGLRGKEADQDEWFVRQLAAEYKVPIEVAQVNTRAHAAGTDLSIEAAARDLRYAALEHWLESLPADVLLTGHTRDDQAETVLMRLFRGAGASGLSGMRAQTGVLMRPFLEVSRDTVREAIVARGLPYREDRSNVDRHFRRNALRLDVMPAITRFEPRGAELIVRAAALLAADAEYLGAEADRALDRVMATEEPDACTVWRAPWLALDSSLRRHTLRLLIGRATVISSRRDTKRANTQPIDAAHVLAMERAIVAGTPLKDRLPDGLALLVDADAFTIRVGRVETQHVPDPVSLRIPGHVAYGGFLISARVLPSRAEIERLLAVAGPWHALLDADRLGADVTVRSRRPGDRLQPMGMNGSRKLQDILVDRKIPREIRAFWPVLETAGEIVWVPGIVLDRRRAASTEMGRVVHLIATPRADLHGTI